MDHIKVISLGGSIVAPGGVDTGFLTDFYTLVKEYLADRAKRIVLVVGGGGPARTYQSAFRTVTGAPKSDAEDWIGIAATRLNGMLLRQIFSDFCVHELVTDPTAPIGTSVGPGFSGQILVAAGWKPGFSTDYDAVVLAERFGADTVINLSNIEKVYTDDPKKNPEARPLDRCSWDDFRKIAGDEWVPGKNVPFDPVATKHAARIGLRVVFAKGSDIDNLGRILRDEPFTGTIIGA